MENGHTGSVLGVDVIDDGMPKFVYQQPDDDAVPVDQLG
jgi:hypothetical protein